MNKKNSISLLLLILLSRTNAIDQDEYRPVFVSSTDTKYDPFLDMDKRDQVYSKSNLNEEEEEIDNKKFNEVKPFKKVIKKKNSQSDDDKPTIVHNQYPYINGMDAMRPSYTTAYEYNAYTPSPSSSL